MSEEAETGEIDDGADEKKNKRLTDGDWAIVRERYELGTHRISELADEFGVSRQALSRRFKENSVTYGSRAHELKQAANQSAVQSAQAGPRFADKRGEWIEETRMAGYSQLKAARNMMTKKVLEATQNGTPLAAIEDELKAFQRFNKVLIENFDFTLNRLLNADEVIDENDLPSLHIEDLTEEDILKHHSDNGTLGDDEDVEELLKTVNGVVEEDTP